MTLYLGIDLGGTNLRAASFGGDPEHVPRELHKEPVGEARDPYAIVTRISDVVERLASGATEAVSVGVGIAAMLRDRAGTVVRSPHLGWLDVPFGRMLADRLGRRFRIGVYNDVNAITWGEAVAGAGRGCRDVLAVYVGTGIGGGVIANGQLLEGTSNCAGEIGHAKVRWDDDAAPCQCGGRGCVEAYLGGSYLVKRIRQELAHDKPRTTVVELAGGRIEDVMPSHVDDAATAGDPWALGLWSELAPLLGVTLGNALCVLNSERLILGGGTLSRTPTLQFLVETALEISIPEAIREPLSIRCAELGDDAGLVGAARLAADGVSIVPAL